MTPAWIVCSWPAVLWQADNPREWQFVHLGTSVVNPPSERQLASGQTVWGNAEQRPTAGVAWDWVELPQGVLALADPFGLVTNLRFVDANRSEIPTIQAALQLNDIVHALPWQDEVHRLLHRHAA